MGTEPPVPETNVLAIASHVVSGHVGNKIAVFTLQSMGCDVAALNTVQFSNHTGYKQWRGTRSTAAEITDLWEGLKLSYLDSFDMMLSGYVPGAAAVEAVGAIAKELREKTRDRPGKFFWVLDPVMGDNGRLYVADDVVPAYRSLVSHADLILPNQFEAELLSDVKITDATTLHKAIEVLHARYGIPHVVITSVLLPLSDAPSAPVTSTPAGLGSMSVVGSSRTSAGAPRAFRISFPVFDGYFSGTGDMFAALMVARMREAVGKSGDGAVLENTASWLSADDVAATALPLAKAAEKVLASMHELLSRTSESMAAEMAVVTARMDAEGIAGEERSRREHLYKSRAAELRLVRNLECLRDPAVEYIAEPMA